jgi:hypothetical protein
VLGLEFALDKGLQPLPQQLHCFADTFVIGGCHKVCSSCL